MAVKNAIYQVDNGSGFDEIHFRTKAEQVLCNNGKSVETNLSEIVSRGSNSQGTWIRFADGTQICYMSLGQWGTINNPWGAGYSASLTAGDFPIEFSEKPYVSVTPVGTTTYFMVMLVRNVSKTFAGHVALWSPQSYGNVEQYCNLIAIGRWK